MVVIGYWGRINSLTTNVPHHIETNQIDLLCKSIDWFLPTRCRQNALIKHCFLTHLN